MSDQSIRASRGATPSPAEIQPENEQAKGKLDSLNTRDAVKDTGTPPRTPPSPSGEAQAHNSAYAVRLAGSTNPDLPQAQKPLPQSETRYKFVPLQAQQTAQPNFEQAAATFAGQDQQGRPVVNPSSDQGRLPRLTRFKNAVLKLFGLKDFYRTRKIRYNTYRNRKRQAKLDKLATAKESRAVVRKRNMARFTIVHQKVAKRDKRSNDLSYLLSTSQEHDCLEHQLKLNKILRRYKYDQVISPQDEPAITKHLRAIDHLFRFQPSGDLDDLYQESKYADNVKIVQKKWELRNDRITGEARYLLMDGNIRGICKWNAHIITSTLSQYTNGEELSEQDKETITNALSGIDHVIGGNSEDLNDLYDDTKRTASPSQQENIYSEIKETEPPIKDSIYAEIEETAKPLEKDSIYAEIEETAKPLEKDDIYAEIKDGEVVLDNQEAPPPPPPPPPLPTAELKPTLRIKIKPKPEPEPERPTSPPNAVYSTVKKKKRSSTTPVQPTPELTQEVDTIS